MQRHGGTLWGCPQPCTSQRRSCCIQRRATFFNSQKPQSRTQGTESKFHIFDMFIVVSTSEDVKKSWKSLVYEIQAYCSCSSKDHLVFLFRLKNTFLRSSLALVLVKSMRSVTWCGLRLGRILGGRAWCHQTLSQMFIYVLIQEVIYLL